MKKEQIGLLSEKLKDHFKRLTPEKKAENHAKMIREKRENNDPNRNYRSWNSAWRTIGDTTKFFRSTWEANYARYLQSLKEKRLILEWEHEPKTFWFLHIQRGTRSYLPDFRVTQLDGSQYWVEVKGWMDSRSKTKLKRFDKYYPEEKLVLVQRKWFKENAPNLENELEGWEPSKY